MARRTAVLSVVCLLAITTTAHERVEEVWVSRFAGPGNFNDFPSGIAVDALGNVYVTGSVSQNGPWDMATIKYDANGNQLWLARYNGPGNGADAARAIALDAAGNVYITGESVGAGTFFDYVTISYDTNGNERWVARYSSADFHADFAVDLALDGAGHVYVTGRSDEAGTGMVDYATIKYDTSGNQQWIAYFNGPDNGFDESRALAVDAAGNAHVTGEWTVKYDAAGNQVWAVAYAPGGAPAIANDIAVDAAGAVHVTGQTADNAYGTVKYDAAGNELWVATFRAGSIGGGARALVVDAAGCVFVTGSIFDSATDFDWATVRYDAQGVERWVARFNGPANGGDMAAHLALDGAGEVYVTGSSMGVGTGDDYTTIKYAASDGSELWNVRYNGPANSGDNAVKIVVDAAANVYVTGSSFDPATGRDWVTIKYAQPEPEPPSYLLTVNKTGMGHGMVTSNPDGIDCGSDCNQQYVNNTFVTLTAKPSLGSIFIGWEGCDTVDNETCRVRVNAERTVTARFWGVSLFK